MLTQNIILDNVKKQLAEWIPEKYGWKRKPHQASTRLQIFFLYTLFGWKKWGLEKGDVQLGIDQFGRSVFRGMQIYVNILKRRGIKLDTVLVQGSRAKGRWKPTSDIDVTIISEDFSSKKKFPWPINKLFGFRKKFQLSSIPLCMSIEPSFCCSREDFMRMLERFDIHALDAIYYGKVIYDKGFWQEAKKRFKETEIKYKLHKTDLRRMLSIL
jgi:predicted nucleotidyltransferase